MSSILPAAWRSPRSLARVTGASTPVRVAIYGLPIAGAVLAYKLAGGGLVGIGAAAAAFPVVFLGTGLVVLASSKEGGSP